MPEEGPPITRAGLPLRNDSIGFPSDPTSADQRTRARKQQTQGPSACPTPGNGQARAVVLYFHSLRGWLRNADWLNRHHASSSAAVLWVNQSTMPGGALTGELY